MITYSSCVDVTMEQIYDAFMAGFSDYSISFNMDLQKFEERFFGPEGNELERSYIALDDGNAIGLVLGGIRELDGVTTMRCGALCVAPDYRRQGIAGRLFELHKSAARDAHCRQFVLEVLKDNDRALHFYKKQGYEVKYTLKYFSALVSSIPPAALDFPHVTEDMTHNQITAFRRMLPDCHIHWQCDTPYYAANAEEAMLALKDAEGRRVGVIAMSLQGQIHFLWVDPSCRSRGIGRYLIHQAADKQKVNRVNLSFPDHASLESFAVKAGFEKQPIEQYEMYFRIS